MCPVLDIMEKQLQPESMENRPGTCRDLFLKPVAFGCTGAASKACGDVATRPMWLCKGTGAGPIHGIYIKVEPTAEIRSVWLLATAAIWVKTCPTSSLEEEERRDGGRGRGQERGRYREERALSPVTVSILVPWYSLSFLFSATLIFTLPSLLHRNIWSWKYRIIELLL